MNVRHRTSRASILATLVLVATFGATASAQDPGVQVRRLEAAGLEAFHNLDVDQADALLARAQAAAERPGVSDADRARVFVAQGVVAIGGHQDTVRGTQLFVRALELDRAVRIDPNLSTPETQSAFSVAQSRVASGAHANVAPTATAAPGATVAPSATTPAPGPRVTATAAPSATAQAAGETTPTTPGTISPTDVDATFASWSTGPIAPLPPAALGESCSEAQACGSGLRCDEGFCVPGREATPSRSRAPRFFFHVGYSVGAGYAGRHMTADSTIPYDPRFKPADWDESVNGPYAPPGYTEAQWLQAIEALYAGYAPSGHSSSDLGTLARDPQCYADADEYCVRLNKPGFLPTGGYRVEIGYFFTERFGASLDLRVQTHAGLGPLSRVMFSFRGLVQITKPRASGFHSHVFAGLSVGQMQLRADQGHYQGPPVVSPGQGMPVDIVLVQTGAARKRPWIETGLGGAQVGILLGYRFTEAFGLFVQPAAYVFFPKTTFAFDATMGVAISF